VAATELARSGQDVVVIEASHVGSGASGGSLGILSTPAAGAGFDDPDEIVSGRPRKVWHRERLAAQNYLLRLIEESRLDCDLSKGLVLLAPTRRNFEQLAATVEMRNAYYGSNDYVLSAGELEREAGGAASRQFAGALVMTDAHHVNPARMILALAELARSLGATICERTDVVGVERDNAGFRVRTNGENLRARDVLLTTGGYTKDFHRFLWRRTLGLPSIAAATEVLPEDEVRDVFRSGRPLLVNRHWSYIARPSPDGRRIILGGPVGQTPGGMSDNVRHLHDYFTRIFPDLAGIEFTHCWTGMIAATRDARAHSGAHEGTWYSVGASGLVGCADAGRRVAQNILHSDAEAAAADKRFPAWPLRTSENLLWRGLEWSTRLLDFTGKSRLR
jgi:glycine/D-amino acid oxidase-like deaminating enzyme